MSAGVCASDRAEDADAILRFADCALYEAHATLVERNPSGSFGAT